MKESQQTLQNLCFRAGAPGSDAEKSELLQKALLSLPEDKREIITLRAIGGHDYTEIAAILSIPEGTVKSRLHRARNFLIKVLESGNFFE